MEAEERPSKIRKLDYDQDHGGQEQKSENIESPKSHERGVTPQIPESNRICKNETSAHQLNQQPPVNAQNDVETAQLSKNQQKKLKRRQAWEAKQPERKAKRKELRQRKKERVRAARASGEPIESVYHARRNGQLVPMTVVFDCNFDGLMQEKEIISLGSQLTRCYSENRNAKFKAHLAVSSFGGRLKERFDTVLNKCYKSWQDFRFYDEDFVEVADEAKSRMAGRGGGTIAGLFENWSNGNNTMESSNGDNRLEHGEVIYLSSDSDDVLTELKPYSTYIIGGLVDRNRHKGICYKHACDKSVRTAKLPIGQYIEMSSRHVLTTNHVLEIMLKWLELGDWGKAFTKVIPKRKGGVLKDTNGVESVVQNDCVIEQSPENSGEESASEEDDQEETFFAEAPVEDEAAEVKAP